MEERGLVTAAGLVTWHNVYTIDRGVLFEEALRRVQEEAALDPDTFSGFYLSTVGHTGYEFPVLASLFPPPPPPPPNAHACAPRPLHACICCSAAPMQDLENQITSPGSLTCYQRTQLPKENAGISFSPKAAVTSRSNGNGMRQSLRQTLPRIRVLVAGVQMLERDERGRKLQEVRRRRPRAGSQRRQPANYFRLARPDTGYSPHDMSYEVHPPFPIWRGKVEFTFRGQWPSFDAFSLCRTKSQAF